MNTQERKAALQDIYTQCSYYNSISGVLGIDQWAVCRKMAFHSD